MLAPILFKAFVALYCYLCIRYVNAFKININHDYHFNNVKSKRYLYCVNKKKSYVLISIPNFFFITQFIHYPLDLGLVLIIIIAFKLRYIKI